jgi:hypothetical protein
LSLYLSRHAVEQVKFHTFSTKKQNTVFNNRITIPETPKIEAGGMFCLIIGNNCLHSIHRQEVYLSTEDIIWRKGNTAMNKDHLLQRPWCELQEQKSINC